MDEAASYSSSSKDMSVSPLQRRGRPWKTAVTAIQPIDCFGSMQDSSYVADLRSKLCNPRSQGIYFAAAFCLSTKTDCYRCPPDESFLGITLLPIAAIMSIAPSGEPGEDAGSGSSARGIRERTLKRYTGQKLLDKPASDPIRCKPMVTTATSQTQLFSTALSELTGANFGRQTAQHYLIG
jgi:hypothetical protein